MPNVVTLQKSSRDIQISTLLKAFRSDLPTFQKVESVEKLTFMLATRFLAATQVLLDWQLYAMIMLFLECSGKIDLKITPDLDLVF